MHLDALADIAKDKSLRGIDLRVLLAILPMINSRAYTLVGHARLADYLDVDRTEISRSLNVLADRAIIESGPRKDKMCSYRYGERLI